MISRVQLEADAAEILARLLADREAELEYKRRYREENREAISERKRRYHEENREAIAEYQRRYREEKKARGDAPRS